MPEVKRQIAAAPQVKQQQAAVYDLAYLLTAEEL